MVYVFITNGLTIRCRFVGTYRFSKALANLIFFIHSHDLNVISIHLFLTIGRYSPLHLDILTKTNT
jgi:hypothetical protein